MTSSLSCLNAPSGAGCFLTDKTGYSLPFLFRLNAPSGAGCFLTRYVVPETLAYWAVLMHLLVLGAF